MVTIPLELSYEGAPADAISPLEVECIKLLKKPALCKSAGLKCPSFEAARPFKMPKPAKYSAQPFQKHQGLGVCLTCAARACTWRALPRCTAPSTSTQRDGVAALLVAAEMEGRDVDFGVAEQAWRIGR